MSDLNPYEEGLERARARIEELEAACWRMQGERDRAIGWRDSDKDRADRAEESLAKAVEALEEIIEMPTRRYQRKIARRTLAELKGTEE